MALDEAGLDTMWPRKARADNDKRFIHEGLAAPISASFPKQNPVRRKALHSGE